MTIPRDNFIHKIDSKPTVKVRKKVEYTSLMSNGNVVAGRDDNAVAYVKSDEYDSKEFFFKVDHNNRLFDMHNLSVPPSLEGVQTTKKQVKYTYTKGTAAAYDYYVRYTVDNSIGMMRSAQREFDNSQQTSNKDYVVMSEWDSMSESDRSRLGIAKTTITKPEEFQPSVVKKKAGRPKKS